MILLDERVGSVELLPHFRPFGVHIEVTHLDFGDAMFAGDGPDGPCMIGVERKRVGDLIQSMRSRRLSGHQLPGLMDSFDYVYLIVEGLYRPGQDGILEVYYRGKWITSRERIMYREIDAYLNTLTVRAGVMVLRSGSEPETSTQIFSLYSWWQKPWAAHTAHSQVYAPPPQRKRAGWVKREVSLCEKMACQIPGIDKKAQDIAAHFKTPQAMVCAGVEGWRKAGLGKVLAERVVKLMRGERGA